MVCTCCSRPPDPAPSCSFPCLLRALPGLLGRHNAAIISEIIDSDVLSACLALISSTRHAWQLAGLRVVADLALSSDDAAQRLMADRLLDAMQASRAAQSCVATWQDGSE